MKWFVAAAGVFVAGGLGVFGTAINERRKLAAEEAAVLSQPLVPGNPLVYVDLSVNDGEPVRLVIQLRADVCPKAAENFRALCTGERGFGYAGTKIHRVVYNKLAQGGDYMTGSGRDSVSIYGGDGFFEDESFDLRHIGPGVLSMANAGRPHSNGSQFFVTLRRQPGFDETYVAFGNVVDVEGMRVVRRLNDTVSHMTAGNLFSSAKSGIVHHNVRIVGTGEMGRVTPAQAAYHAEQYGLPVPPEAPKGEGEGEGEA